MVDIRGKGMLFVGIIQYVRDEAGDMDARKRGVQESQLQDDRTVERLKMDLNNYCIGDDKQSWALASDGVKLHDGYPHAPACCNARACSRHDASGLGCYACSKLRSLVLDVIVTSSLRPAASC